MTRKTRGRVIHRSLGVLTLLLLGAGITTGQDRAPSSGGVPQGVPAPASTAPGVHVSDDYRVGPGDVIDVLVWKEPEVSSSVVIRPDGKISLPLINDLEVTGKTPLEIREIVVEKLSPYINFPNVTVTVKQVNSKKVYIIGEVNGAGAYQMTQPITVLQILTEAGGLRPFADQKSIYILRMNNGKQEKFSFNYKDVVKGEKMQQNILLQPGDTIVVP